jgi:hypothetical protein
MSETSDREGKVALSLGFLSTRVLSVFKAATDRVTAGPAATHKAPVPLSEVFDVSTHPHRSLVGSPSCHTRPPARTEVFSTC